MKINLGCGRDYLEGYVNCDINKRYKADLYFDMESEIWPFKDNSVSYIKAWHVLEHLSTGYLHVWKEMYRICKNKAKILLAFPHHLHDNYFSDPTHKTPITVDGILLFDRQRNLDLLEIGYSNSSLALELDIDFRILEKSCIINPLLTDLSDEVKNNILDICITSVNVIEEVRLILSVNKPKLKKL